MSALCTPGSQLQQQQPIAPAKNAKLYKTELCRSWMEHGRCNYGERCQYAHGEVEKRPIPRHPKYKTEACQSFHQTGYCPYGPRCHFIHNEPELLSQLSSISAALSSFPSTQMRAGSGGPGGPAMTPGAPNLHSSSLLGRMASLPCYGSAGESSPSGSSADSGSESPNGSFSPGLDLDDGGPFTIGFMNAQPLVRRQPLSQQQQTFNSAYDQKTEPMAGLLNDLMTFKFDDKWEETTVSRLPVFAQLSSNQ